jgi:hypothetical protein
MSDVSDRNIVLIIFFISFLYLYYLKIKIQFSSDWNNLKCNPMTLWLNSFFINSADSDVKFSDCMQQYIKPSLDKGIMDISNNYTIALNTVNSAQTLANNYTDTFNNAITDLNNQYSTTQSLITNIGTQQQTYNSINTQLAQSDSQLSNFTNTIQNVYKKIMYYLPKTQL